MILKLLTGVVLGGTLGFVYDKIVGCTTGSCLLTSNPWISTIYGAVLGVLIAASFR